MAVPAAAAITALIVGSGAAVDMTRMHNTRLDLQNIADNAALAAISASDGDKTQAEAIAKEFVTKHTSNLSYDVTLINNSAVFSQDVIDVQLSADVKLTYAAFMGATQKPVAARSRAVYDRPALEEFPHVSVAFVLDMSGSMSKNFSGQSRIDTLKASVKDLFKTIKDNNPNDPDLKTKLCTGVYSYNWGISDYHSHAIKNGWGHTKKRVNRMTSWSETIPAQAMEAALQDLRDEPLTPEGEKRHKVLVYMTDGEVDDGLSMRYRYSSHHNYDGSPFTNDNLTFTERTREVCRMALEEGTEVIAVGMNAPSEGVAMLRSCSEASDLSNVVSYFDNARNKYDFDIALSQILMVGTEPTARLLD